jgi:hypothetical protein
VLRCARRAPDISDGRQDEEKTRARAMPAPMKQKASIVNRLAEGVRGLFKGEAADADDEATVVVASAEMEARPEPVSPHEIGGRIVLQRDDSLTIELVSWKELEWLPQALKLQLRDGTVIDVAIAGDRTTKSGNVPAGRVLRLTVQWTGGPLAATPVSLTMTLEGRMLTVVF